MRRLGAGLFFAFNAAISCGGIFCHGTRPGVLPVSADELDEDDGIGFPTAISTLDWLLSVAEEVLFEDGESSSGCVALTGQFWEPPFGKHQKGKVIFFSVLTTGIPLLIRGHPCETTPTSLVHSALPW